MSADIHVAAAIIRNSKNEVLISRRADHVHQGGFWEFPGGKVENGETPEQALRREIAEELGLVVNEATLFRRVYHQYPDKNVLLDFYLVESFSGEAGGMENQPIRWQPVDGLRPEEFPMANRGVLRSLQLPRQLMITGRFRDEREFEQRLRQSLEAGITLVQLRAKASSTSEYESLVALARPVCAEYSARLLLNCTLGTFEKYAVDGLHLSSQQLHDLRERPFDHSLLLSASCHTEADIQQAIQLQSDLLLLSPVRETGSHPGVPGIGWKRFAELVRQVDIPVYALGGMQSSDIDVAVDHGAQGVAAISSFWQPLV